MSNPENKERISELLRRMASFPENHDVSRQAEYEFLRSVSNPTPQPDN